MMLDAKARSSAASAKSAGRQKARSDQAVACLEPARRMSEADHPAPVDRLGPTNAFPPLQAGGTHLSSASAHETGQGKPVSQKPSCDINKIGACRVSVQAQRGFWSWL